VSALTSVDPKLSPETAAFYREAMHVLSAAGLPFLCGGSYALHYYAGIQRHTKDFDIFIRPDDCRRALDTLAAIGTHTELTFPHWLGKAFRGDEFIDLIYSSGNSLAPVDEEWFAHAVSGEVLGVHVKLVPPEEMIWQKAYIQERERYDGADIAHLIRARGRQLDWSRLLSRFGPSWRVLLAQLVLFGFIYPSERDCVPPWVMNDLMVRLQEEGEGGAPQERVCRGTLLSREQYLIDIERWGYADPRESTMSHADLDRWTRAILEDPSPPPGHVTLLDT
jgi:hypothetical protein